MTGSIALVASVIYAGGYDRKVAAVDVETGALLWTRRLQGPVITGIIAEGDVLFAGTDRPDDEIYALRLQDGQQLWRRRIGGTSAPLGLIDGLLIAQSRRGVVFGLNPVSGRVTWQRQLGTGRAPPVRADSGNLLVATVDSLFRLSSRDGTVLQRVKAPGAVVSGWAHHDSALVAGTADSTIIAIRPQDLAILWRAKVDAPVFFAPLAHNDTLFAVTRTGSIYAVPSHSSRAERIAQLSWPVTAAPVLFRDLLLLGGADGVLRALRLDGTEVWRVGFSAPLEVSPLVLPDGLLGIGGRGDLRRYRL